jgi:putative addiction module CopG family antidote
MKEGDHFDSFISSQIQNGGYGSASEVIRSAFRLLETQETKMKPFQLTLKAKSDLKDIALFTSRKSAKYLSKTIR